MLAIWQGGFSAIAGLVGAALVLVVTLRRSAALYRSLASLGAVMAFLAAKRLTSPPVLINRSQDVSRAAGSGALPTTLFVAGDGMIRESHAGEISRAVLDDAIDNLREPRP